MPVAAVAEGRLAGSQPSIDSCGTMPCMARSKRRRRVASGITAKAQPRPGILKVLDGASSDGALGDRRRQAGNGMALVFVENQAAVDFVGTDDQIVALGMRGQASSSSRDQQRPTGLCGWQSRNSRVAASSPAPWRPCPMPAVGVERQVDAPERAPGELRGRQKGG